MREMKDSGVEWIEEIPIHWNVRPIKNSFTIVSGSTPDSDKCEYWDGDIPWITPADFKTIDKITSGGSRFITKEGYNSCSTNLIPKGSIIFSKRAPIGSVVINSVDLCTNQGCLSCIKNEKADSTYFYYVMSIFDDVFNLYGSGTTFKEISATTFGDVILPLPLFLEQKRIASFLDTKCTEINSISEDIRKEIETLQEYRKSVITEAVTKGLDPNVEMKDSGILWAPQVPQSWQVSRIGYFCQKLERYFSPDDVPLLCTNRGKISIRPEEMVGIMISQDNAMQGIRKGDIAIHGMDTWHGAIAISDIDGKITRVVHVCDSYGDNRFIVYYLQSLAFNNVYKLISNGVRGNTSDFRSWNKVEHILVPIPNIDEQNIICDYLDAKCAEIDSIISDKQKQLDTLAEYRKSLIYEYVTGKKEVPTT